MDGRITVRFDGGSRGNPGPAGVGAVLEADDGTSLQAFGQFIGHATNNVAEYKGLIAGLEAAQRLGVKSVRVLGDSELVIKQVRGEYKVKNEALKPLHARAIELLGKFEKREVGHNLRGHNSLADSLANLAMDKKRNVSDDELGGTVSFDSSSDVDADPYAAEAAPSPAGEKGGQRFACVRCGCVLQMVRPGLGGEWEFRCRCGAPMREE